jgi:hypothetical protein
MQTAQFLNGKGHCLKCDAVVAETDKHPLNPEWTRKMRAKFDALNTDGKANKNGLGTLDFDEMSSLLLKGNPNFTQDELRDLFDSADGNGNGVIEFSEFLWFLYGQQKQGKGKGGGKGKAPAERRAPGEACTNKLAASSACESDSGVCPKNDGGPHHFKYGQCQYCRMSEGQLAKGDGTFAYAGGAGGCPKGGKCMFQFSKCKKCGKAEF